MLQQGWAEVYEQAGAEYGKWGKDHFVAIEKEAKNAGRGVWARPEQSVLGRLRSAIVGGDSEGSGAVVERESAAEYKRKWAAIDKEKERVEKEKVEKEKEKKSKRAGPSKP